MRKYVHTERHTDQTDRKKNRQNNTKIVYFVASIKENESLELIATLAHVTWGTVDECHP